MKPLAIIPARAGSKRLPGKNREKITAGLELWQYPVMQAQACGLFGPRVWVTSDYEDIFTGSWDMLDPFHGAFRGPDLAADDTPMMAVVQDVIARARRDVPDELFDAVVLLQPTSPLRLTQDIRAALELLHGGDAVISVVETPEPEIFTIGHAGRLRSIDMRSSWGRPIDGALVRPNGAVFAITTKALDAGYDWWTAPVVTAYVMPPERSVDIDTIVDLERARELWTKQQ